MHVHIKAKFITATNLIAILLITGTICFHFIEGWDYIDSFYFTGITLTTIGYGDFAPITPFGKVFTIFFALMGVGVFLYALSVIADHYFFKRESIHKERLERSDSKINKFQENFGGLKSPRIQDD